jgi:hypothetical protein
MTGNVGDYWGAKEFFDDKANPFEVENWLGLISTVEGRDKFLKLIQFTARTLRWHSAQYGDEAQEDAFAALYQSILEGRKSARILKGLNNINQLFIELPTTSSSYEKALLAGNHLGLAFLWHFDYLAHAHRAKFAHFEVSRLKRISSWPSFMWSAGNICQILLGIQSLRKSTSTISEIREELLAVPSQLQGEPVKEIRVLRIQRFKGWLQVTKGLADLATSTSMTGLEIHKRYPLIFHWLNEPVIGFSGILSASIVLLSNFPTQSTAAASKGGGCEKLQKERNTALAIFAYMQLSTLFKARPARA